MNVLSPFIPVLCYSDRLFLGESCPRLDAVRLHSVYLLGDKKVAYRLLDYRA